MRHLLVALVVLLVAVLGCTKRVALEQTDLARLLQPGMIMGEREEAPAERVDPRTTLVVTFDDGTEVKGKIHIGSRVDIVTGTATYSGYIYDLSDTLMVVRDCTFIEASQSLDAQIQRMEHARKDVGGGLPRMEFDLRKIRKIEKVKVDALKTASHAVFWTLAGAVEAMLLSEKS